MSFIAKILHCLICSPLQFSDVDNSGSDASADPFRTVRMAGGFLTRSVFHWREPQVLTATAAGSLVVWDALEDQAANQHFPKFKLIHLQKQPITVLNVTDR